MISQPALASLVAAIYEAGVDFDAWPHTLSRMAQALGGHSSNLLRQGLTASESWGVTVGVQDSYVQSYLDHFHAVNPLWSKTGADPAGSVHSDAMVVSRADLERTEFFRDFLAPQDIGGLLNAVVLMEDGRQSIVTVHFSRPVEDESLRLFNLITPHLQRAAELNVRLARADLARAASEAVMDRIDQAILFVDADARLIFANRCGEALLISGDGLRLTDGVLHGQSMADSAVLHAAIDACSAPTLLSAALAPVSLSRRGGRAPLAVRAAPAPNLFPAWIAPGRPTAILCVSDPELTPRPALEDLRTRFGLTRAQALLATEILQADGIQAAADRLSITRATARTHLAQIFEKTGTQRQSELVRLLLSSGLSLRSGDESSG